MGSENVVYQHHAQTRALCLFEEVLGDVCGNDGEQLARRDATGAAPTEKVLIGGGYGVSEETEYAHNTHLIILHCNEPFRVHLEDVSVTFDPRIDSTSLHFQRGSYTRFSS